MQIWKSVLGRFRKIYLTDFKSKNKEYKMSDKMRSIPFRELIHWIFEEYEKNESIFGVHGSKFYQKKMRII